MPKTAESKKEEEKAAAALAERVEKMSPYEKRKFEMEQKRKARMEVDLEPERLMKAGMEQ